MPYITKGWIIYRGYLATCTDMLTRIESGSDDPDNLGHLGHFLVGQVDLIHKLNYMDVTRIFNRSHVLYSYVGGLVKLPYGADKITKSCMEFL